ncbi:MAG: hypothetical protein LBL46_01315 [Rickettsiales bacterium]|jgi:hypothetical protein|nr:hypothetical protein [Rickettsiales bacterium]
MHYLGYALGFISAALFCYALVAGSERIFDAIFDYFGKKEPPFNHMPKMSIDEIKQFIKTNKNKIVGKRITATLLRGATDFTQDKPIDFIRNPMLWEGPIVLKLGAHQLEFDASADYFSINFDSLKILGVIDVKNMPPEEIEKLNAFSHEYWDISHAFQKDIIGQKIKGIKIMDSLSPFTDINGKTIIEQYDVGIMITLENSKRIQIINAMDWITMEII